MNIFYNMYKRKLIFFIFIVKFLVNIFIFMLYYFRNIFFVWIVLKNVDVIVVVKLLFLKLEDIGDLLINNFLFGRSVLFLWKFDILVFYRIFLIYISL